MELKDFHRFFAVFHMTYDEFKAIFREIWKVDEFFSFPIDRSKTQSEGK